MRCSRLALWAGVFAAAVAGTESAAAEVPGGAAQVTAAAPPYALPEALADALSGPLQLVGKGAWHGLWGSLACVYRNERVLVVDEYCRPRELNSFGVIIASPTRGWVSIYAEGKAPVSKLDRSGYLIFTGRSEITLWMRRTTRRAALCR